jgi:Ca2+-binding EF-hand superfamily protein
VGNPSIEDDSNRKNIQFARDLFKSWDRDGDGSISESELVKPLVSLGLAPDHKFARKICQALVPPARA